MLIVLHFWIEDNGATFDDAEALEVHQFGDQDEDICGDDVDLHWAAEQYAKHYYNNDNHDANWPIVITVSTPEGKLLGKVNVALEFRAIFQRNKL
jgi:hypothetical protein